MINELAKYKGIIFLAATGNGGGGGIFTNLEPGNSRDAIGIGSFDTNKFFAFRALHKKNPKFVLRKYKEFKFSGRN